MKTCFYTQQGYGSGLFFFIIIKATVKNQNPSKSITSILQVTNTHMKLGCFYSTFYYIQPSVAPVHPRSPGRIQPTYLKKDRRKKGKERKEKKKTESFVRNRRATNTLSTTVLLHLESDRIRKNVVLQKKNLILIG